MVHTLVEVAVIWTLASVPAGILVGRLLHRAQPLPVRVTDTQR